MISAYNWKSAARTPEKFTQQYKERYIKESFITDNTNIIREVIMNFLEDPVVNLELDDISSFLHLTKDSGLTERFVMVSDFSYRNCKLKLDSEIYKIRNEYAYTGGPYVTPWYNKNITAAVTYWEREAETVFLLADRKYWPHQLKEKKQSKHRLSLVDSIIL